MAPVANGNTAANGHAVHANGANVPINPTNARHEQREFIRVNSDKVNYSTETIVADYEYLNTHVEKVHHDDGTTEYVATPFQR